MGRKAKKRLTPQARAFIAGREDSARLPATDPGLGFSPARSQAGMCRTPDRRARHKAQRRDARAEFTRRDPQDI